VQLLCRFLRGGALLYPLAFVADVVRPKRFAGLFAPPPSSAIATLALTASTCGADVAAIEQRSEPSYGDERSGCAPGASRTAAARDETAFGAPAPRSDARKWSLPAPAVTIEMGDETDRG
jgi:hypothetical protein